MTRTILRLGKRCDAEQTNRCDRFREAAEVDLQVFDVNATATPDRIAKIELTRVAAEDGHASIAGWNERAVADANIAIPLGTEIATKIDKRIVVQSCVFDGQVATAGDRDAAQADDGVLNGQVPTMEVNVDAVEATVFDPKVLVEIRTENAPVKQASFGGYIAERTIE